MLLETVIEKLVNAPDDPERAEELAQMAFMDWLAFLPGDESFPVAAVEAFDRTREASHGSDAVAAFRALLVEATQMPPQPLELSLPAPYRRGGQRSRRLSF